MSIKTGKGNSGNTVLRQEIASLRAEVATLGSLASSNAESVAANLIEEIRNNLVAVPVEGEAWDARKSYVTGDTVTDEGVSYTALRYSRNKKPSEHTEHWTITAPPTVQTWESIEDGTVIMEGTEVSYNGAVWVCVTQHIKSLVYKPKATSTKWNVKE